MADSNNKADASELISAHKHDHYILNDLRERLQRQYKDFTFAVVVLSDERVAITVVGIGSGVVFEKMSALCIWYLDGFKNGFLKGASAFSLSIP
jgi:hypothetical protein